MKNLTPITRKEMFMAKAAGQDVTPPEPITREEMFLSDIAEHEEGQGGSGGAVVKVKGDYPNYECLASYADITAMYNAGVMPSVALLNDSDEVVEIYAGTRFETNVVSNAFTLEAKHESYTSGEEASVSVAVVYLTFAQDDTVEFAFGDYYFSVTDDA